MTMGQPHISALLGSWELTVASDMGGLGEQVELLFDISFEPKQGLAEAIGRICRGAWRGADA